MSSIKPVSSPTQPIPQPVKTAPTREQIQLRAYEIYLDRRGAPGSELEDWVRAERELLQKYQKPASTAKSRAA